MKQSNCIGVKDAASKNFFGRPDVLADVMNVMMFGGKIVVQPEQLSSICGEYARIVRGEDGRYRTDNSYRDRLFDYDNGTDKVAVGIEFQSVNEKDMILRIMGYDNRCYEELRKLGKKRRVSSIVLSFDENGEGCPDNLEQVFGKTNAIPEQYLPNYSFVSLNIYDLAKKIDMFHCRELRDVLYLFKCAKEGSPFMDELEAGKAVRTLSRDAAFVCAAFLGFDVDIGDNEKEIGMSKVVSDFRDRCMKEGELLGMEKGKLLGMEEGKVLGMEKGKLLGMEEGKVLGMEEGKLLGMEEGTRKAIRGIVERLIRKSLGIHEISSLIGVSEEAVKEIELSMGQ